jgi:dGTPase
VSIRSDVEEEERRRLSPYAQKAADSRGRIRPERPCDIRTDFQRDRDRIIHSKAFRRLKDKTQVFLAAEGDHFRTRLTHTLEVAQIARTIARALRLNEDLTEAIALGHDLGHTPFGHAGEDVLNELCPGGFRHYEQSLRVVDVLEGGKGLNLTFEVRDGIRNHTAEGRPVTLEARVVHFSDRIAYVNHDIDDALRGGVIAPSDLPRAEIDVLGRTHSERIDRLVRDVIANSLDRPEVVMGDEVAEALAGLRRFLFERVYVGSSAKREEEKAKGIVRALFEHYAVEGLPDGGSGWDAVRDYVAGMTDRFAIGQFRRLFLPLPWQQDLE